MKSFVENILHIIKEIIINPVKFWKEQGEEKRSGNPFLSYVLPLVVATGVAVFVGEFIKRTGFFLEYPLLKSIRMMSLFILYYFISVFFTNELLKTFGGEKNKALVRLLVAYSSTPVLLVSVVTGLLPFLYIVDILGVYSFYLFWIGVKELVVLPELKKSRYILIVLLINFFVFSFLSIFLSKLVTAYY